MLQNKEAWLQGSKLAKVLCTGHREFGTNRWRFLSKANTLYFGLCKPCEFMMCILIVNHQLNCIHPWCSWEGTFPERCSPFNRCHTFWNRNIVLLPIVLGKVSCVPKNKLCELYGVMFWKGLAWNSWSCHAFPKKMSMHFIFGVPSWLYTISHSVLWRVLQNLNHM